MNAPYAPPLADAAARLTTTLHPDEFPPQYAMICDGNCLAPVVLDGTKLVFDREASYRPGDLVILHFRPELVRPGDHQLLVKKLVIAPGHAFWREGQTSMGDIRPTVIVAMLNPRRVLYVNPHDLLGIHKCVGTLPSDERTCRMSDEDVRAAYGSPKKGRKRGSIRRK